MRVYHPVAAKRAVVVKDDDLLTKKELAQHATEIAQATLQELQTWFDNDCFRKALLKQAKKIMTSRYVSKWKWVKQTDGSWKKIIRMRLALRGFMDSEAYSLEVFAGTAKRTSQRILASEAATHKEWILASLDVDKAFLKGFTHKELAEATGEKPRGVYFLYITPGQRCNRQTV